MTMRSTTSAHQPIPPNYATGTSAYRNIGRYRAITRDPATQRPVGPNMSTAPTTANNTQYQYIPRTNG